MLSQELCTSLSSETILDYTSFEDNFLRVLNKHAPLKKKVFHANHAPYVTKVLRKAIMKRPYSVKLCFKKNTTESLKKYKKHKNFCSRLYKKERKKYFDILDVNKTTDNKTFWKNIQLAAHEIFEQRNIQYNLRSQTDFQLGPVKTVNWGLRALRYLGPKIWNIVPFEVKNSETLEQFNIKIKSWKPTHCPFNLC